VAFLKLLDLGNKNGNVKQKSQVIAISSIGAFNRVPLAGFAYSASKAAVIHLMKQFATALVPWDIRSNVIAPGCMLYRSSLVIYHSILTVCGESLSLGALRKTD
jgi:NAD(P)-dependent dehydrogenase (short-subunit alcohol dehydrogenase family)